MYPYGFNEYILINDNENSEQNDVAAFEHEIAWVSCCEFIIST